MEFEEIQLTKKLNEQNKHKLINKLANATLERENTCHNVLKECKWNYAKALKMLEMKEGN